MVGEQGNLVLPAFLLQAAALAETEAGQAGGESLSHVTTEKVPRLQDGGRALNPGR